MFQATPNQVQHDLQSNYNSDKATILGMFHRKLLLAMYKKYILKGTHNVFQASHH